MEVTEEVGGLAKAQLKFAVWLYKALCQREENVVFCPTSICAALAMLGLGAKENTVSEIRQVMHVSSLEATSEVHNAFQTVMTAVTDRASTTSMDLLIANCVFLQEGLSVLPEYSDAIERHYGSSIQYVDFRKDATKASDFINSGIAEQTQDKIGNVLQPNLLGRLTKMVLLNAVYMKGLWATKFQSDNSFSDTFHLLDGTERQVDMMHQHGTFRLGTSEKLNCSILEMPYANYQFAMYIVLPVDTEAFLNLERSLDADELEGLLNTLHKRNSMYVWLPCFQAESSLPLHSILPDIGIRDLFSEKEADLSGTSNQKLAVSTFVHKTVLVINEKGGEPADITTVVDIAVSLDLLDEFYVNKPFIYFVRHHQTGTILLVGRMTSPPPATRKSCGRLKCFCQF